MPTDGIDNLELYETREKELLEELGRLAMDDPKREKIRQELDTIAKIRVNYEQANQNRLNNNARNDIEERKVEVEEAKVENDRKRMKLSFGQALLYLFGGAGISILSYHMDSLTPVYKKGERLSEKLVDYLKGAFGR